MMAINCENYEVSEAVSNLGQMMHYCVSNEQHLHPLPRNCAFLQAYYDIRPCALKTFALCGWMRRKRFWACRCPSCFCSPLWKTLCATGSTPLRTARWISGLPRGWRGSGQLVLVVRNNGRPMTGQERQRVNENLRKAESTPPNAP